MNREEAENLTGYMYREHLGREPEADALGNCVSYLVNGGKSAELERQILSSEEYKTRRRLAAHPLAEYPYLFNADNVAYFSHRGLFRPLSIQVETVNICNNDCIFCPYSLQTRKKQAMSMVTFERVVRAYEEIGGGQIGLTPMVGEIFLDKLLL